MTTIVIRYSTTSGHVPAVGSLAQGQLAVNIPNALIWIGNGPANPAVQLIGQPGPPGPAGPPGPLTPGPPGPIAPTCFLAGTLVEMASGFLLPIELVKVGDRVRGRFDEINTVIALDRTIIGQYRRLFGVNGELWTSGDHKLLTPGGWAVADVPEWDLTDGVWFPVISDHGLEEWLWSQSFCPSPKLQFSLGDGLVTTEGVKPVATLALGEHPASTPLYNLVTDGSHCHRANGYIAGAWVDERDFDYSRWEPIAGVDQIMFSRPARLAA